MASSPFEEVELKVCVSLLPSELGDIYGGIRRNIYQFLMRYNESVGGVLLTVSELAFEDGAREGRIMDEMPHVHFAVKGKALVFRPKPGQVLESRVNKVTSTHIGMLVCGIFNASVASKAMGSGFHFDAIASEWRGPGGQIIAAGDVTRFVVTRMHEAAGLISIEGSLEGLPEEDRQGVDNGDGGGNVLMNRQPGPLELNAAATATAKAGAKKAKKKAKSIEKGSGKNTAWSPRKPPSLSRRVHVNVKGTLDSVEQKNYAEGEQRERDTKGWSASEANKLRSLLGSFLGGQQRGVRSFVEVENWWSNELNFPNACIG